MWKIITFVNYTQKIFFTTASEAHEMMLWDIYKKKSYYTACWTHLDLDILAVDDLYDANDVIEHQPHFLTVVWWMETKIASVFVFSFVLAVFKLNGQVDSK